MGELTINIYKWLYSSSSPLFLDFRQGPALQVPLGHSGFPMKPLQAKPFGCPLPWLSLFVRHVITRIQLHFQNNHDNWSNMSQLTAGSWDAQLPSSWHASKWGPDHSGTHDKDHFGTQQKNQMIPIRIILEHR